MAKLPRRSERPKPDNKRDPVYKIEPEGDKNLNDIVNMLVKNAYRFLEWKLIAAINQEVGMEIEAEGLPEGYFNFDHQKLDYIIDLVRPMLKDVQQTKKIQAESSKQIISMLSNGKITIAEAKGLFEMIDAKVELEAKEKKSELKNKMFEELNKTIDKLK